MDNPDLEPLELPDEAFEHVAGGEGNGLDPHGG